MKKLSALLLAIAMCAGAFTACSSEKQLTGTGDGYGGEIKVTLTQKDGKITALEITGEKETPGIGVEAMEELKEAILAAGTTEGVDVVANATWTSNGVFYAINNALDPRTYPYPKTAGGDDAQAVSSAEATMGPGVYSSGRIGPGKDDTDTQVYSFNQVYAAVVFDKDGKILSMKLDQLEVATPNYDGEGMPHFAGFPGQSYNEDKDHDAVVDGTLTYDDDAFLQAVSEWQTKRERGDGYKMTTGTWRRQADKFEELFVGMTVEEVNRWFEKYCSDLNGRPLKAPGEDTKEEDKAKYEALTEDEKARLADVTAQATMSLNDSHGNILRAIKAAVDAKANVDITVGQ